MSYTTIPNIEIWKLQNSGLIDSTSTKVVFEASIHKEQSVNTSKIIKKLVDADIIPSECRVFKVTMETNRVVTVTTERNFDQGQFAQLVDLLIEFPEEAKEFITEGK